MSDKKSSETVKSEPIKIETTTLRMEISTSGDFVTKPFDLVPFHPNMADMKDLSNNNFIFFPSFVKITMSDLKKAGIGGTDLKKIFTTLDKYIKLIRYVTSKERVDDYSLIVNQSQAMNYAMGFAEGLLPELVKDAIVVQKREPLTPEEIITNNIGLIKSLFFPEKGHFFMLGHDYVIGKSRYLPPYIMSAQANEKLKSSSGKVIPLFYEITVELELLDAATNPDAGEFGRLNCKAKKTNITNDFNEMFGAKLGYTVEKKATLPSVLTPTSTTTKRGFGILQVEWEKRNQYVKPPETEAERIALEKGWTPLQKKMAKLDKLQEDYKKIPPGWIKEHADLKVKYENFAKKMAGYSKEYAEKKNEDTATNSSFTKDQLKELKTKIEQEIKQLFAPMKESTDDEKKNKTARIQKVVDYILQEKREETVINNEINNDQTKSGLKQLKEEEEKSINNKYISPFIQGLAEKEKDVATLKQEKAALIAEYDAMATANPNDYNLAAKKKAIDAKSADLIRKETELEVLKKKREDLIAKWKADQTRMDTEKGSIKSSKTAKEKEETEKSIRGDLANVKKEIEDIRKKIKIKQMYQGNFTLITEEDKDNFETKKKEPQPVEELSVLENELITLTGEMFAITKQFNDSKTILQELIIVYSDEIKRYKELADSKKKKIESKDKELAKIGENIKNISLAKGPSSISDIEKLEKDKEPIKNKINLYKNLYGKFEDIKKSLEEILKQKLQTRLTGPLTTPEVIDYITEYNTNLATIKDYINSTDEKLYSKVLNFYIKNPDEKKIDDIKVLNFKEKKGNSSLLAVDETTYPLAKSAITTGGGGSGGGRKEKQEQKTKQKRRLTQKKSKKIHTRRYYRRLRPHPRRTRRTKRTRKL